MNLTYKLALPYCLIFVCALKPGLLRGSTSKKIKLSGTRCSLHARCVDKQYEVSLKHGRWNEFLILNVLILGDGPYRSLEDQ
jgi:hypothetical protein